jgi:cbb3-type cytochrome oxidase subunit 3
MNGLFVIPAAKFVIEEGAHQVQHTWIGAVSTLLFVFVFVSWAVWAYLPSRRAKMDAAALLPFDDHDGGEA